MTIQKVALMQPVGASYSRNTAQNYVAITIDGAGEGISFDGQAPRAGNITAILFRTGTVTTGAVLDVRVETLTTATPSGTLWATGTNGPAVVLASDDAVQLTATLTNAATVAQGDFMRVVLAWASGGAATMAVIEGARLAAQFPKIMQNTGSGWAGAAGSPTVALVYSDGEIWGYDGQSNFPSNAGNETWNSGSSPPERGVAIAFPAPLRIKGFYMFGDLGIATVTAKLYNSSMTLLASLNLDGAIHQAVSLGNGGSHFLFASPISVTAGTYYLTLLNTSANNVILANYAANSSAGRNALPFGSEAQFVGIASGVPTTNSSEILEFYPLIDGIDDGSGGGGDLAANPLRGYI